MGRSKKGGVMKQLGGNHIIAPPKVETDHRKYSFCDLSLLSLAI